MEFVTNALDLWANVCGQTLSFSRQGKLTDYGFIESFNASFRAGLKASRFLSLQDAP